MTTADIIQADAGGVSYIADVRFGKARVVDCQCGDLMRQRWCTAHGGENPCWHGETCPHIHYDCESCGRWTLGKGEKVVSRQLTLFAEATP